MGRFRWRFLAAIAAVLMLGAWRLARPVPRAEAAVAAQVPTRPTPAPPFAGTPETFSTIRDYVSTLTFGTRHPLADAQFLLNSRSSVGPFARWSVEIGAHLVDSAGMARGRIIGRLTLAGRYNPMRLPAGNVYVWAEMLPRPRVLFIPEAGGPTIESGVKPVELLGDACEGAAGINVQSSGTFTGLTLTLCYCCKGKWCQTGDTTRSLGTTGRNFISYVPIDTLMQH